jgi:ferredoxin
MAYAPDGIRGPEADPTGAAPDPGGAPGAGQPGRVFGVDGLEALVESLAVAGYDVVGPTVRDHAVVLDRLDGADDLPVGWGDEQAPGQYRLVRRDDEARFGWAVGPHSAKRCLFPPREQVLVADRDADGQWSMRTPPAPVDERPLALVGLRPCEVAALDVLDAVLVDGQPDPSYRRRRAEAFTVVVGCGAPADTCFCASMGTGPSADRAIADVAMTEVLDEAGHRFVAVAGSGAGEALVAALPGRLATDDDHRAARAVTDAAAAAQSRRLDARTARAALPAVLEHPAWQQLGDRCLGCTSCTLVCPTCFCHTIDDTMSLDGDHAERWRSWDSCFSVAFTETAGWPVRSSNASRYRQWLTHKLASWWDQFATSGCVGCGRCITWCPVGIDLTAEVPVLVEQAGMATALGASLVEGAVP